MKTNMNITYSNRMVLRIPGVSAATGLSKTAINDKENKFSKYFDPSFPARFKIGARSVGWDACEINLWIETKKNERNGMER
jgi:prophage regulatory protein